MNRTVIVLSCLAALITGCSSSPRVNEKRERDRAMMKLSDAERQRDEARAELELARKGLSAADARTKQAQAELDAATARLKKSTEEMAQSQAQQQAQNAKLTAEIETLRRELNASVAKASVPASPSTRPVDMNK